MTNKAKLAFDMEAALRTLREGKDFACKDGILTPLIEAVHWQFRKLTKTKGGFANENNLLKWLTPVYSRRLSAGRTRYKTGI